MDVYSTGRPRRRILLTGSTGFVGQGLLERLLSEHPDCDIDLLLRRHAKSTPHQRLHELLSRAVFAPWRGRVGDAHVARVVAERVTILSGGLSELDRLLVDRPPYDIVVHCAGDVSFDEAIDTSFSSNVGGVVGLYEALRAAGAHAHVVHVSTAYVWADRVDIGREVAVDHDVCWRTEFAAAVAMRARREAEWHADVVRTELSGLAPTAPAQLTRRRARWIEEQLSADGHRRARELGWTDVYTFTKALGERVAEELWAGRPLTILRPAIIESALSHPYPGWMDGFKVADPLLAAYAKNRLPGFPGLPDAVIDVVPVDVVVNATLAAALAPPQTPEPRYLHVGTSVTNPTTLDDIRTNVQGYFAAHPWVDSSGRTVRPSPWRFASPEALHHRLRRHAALLAAVGPLLDVTPGRLGVRVRRASASLSRRLTLTTQFVKLYGPYACSTTRFDDAGTRALRAQWLHRDDGPAYLRDGFDTATIDWARYWTQIHLPSLVDLLLITAGRADECRTARCAPLEGDLAIVPTVAPLVPPALAGLIEAGLTLVDEVKVADAAKAAAQAAATTGRRARSD
ncbi:MAG: SDR family oxidoreductase [Dermatophilaceae bacterium]